MSYGMSPLIELYGVNKTFREGRDSVVHAVVDATLVVRPGEFVLISGPSGSGKTTLLSIMGCMAAPTSGHVSVCGEETLRLSQDRLAQFRLRNVGFVFQSFRLLDALSVAENVELPMNLAGTRRPDSTRRVARLLEEVGLMHRGLLTTRALSAGEKQRVALARALANDPPLLMADEPTGSLDSAAGEVVIGLLRRQAAERRRAVVVVSHDSRIHGYADRVVTMADGRIHEVEMTDPHVRAAAE